jgi:hypothetical protein
MDYTALLDAVVRIFNEVERDRDRNGDGDGDEEWRALELRFSG